MRSSTPFDSWSAAPEVTVAFSRAARIALVGLLLPTVIGMVASASGMPLRGTWRSLLSLLPAAGFIGSGALAAESLGRGRRGTWLLAVGFAAAGLGVVPAYDSLQGLSGRESVPLVAGVVMSAFALGFAAAAAGGALAMNLTGRRAVRVATHGALAGACGGLIAVLPFLLATTRGTVSMPYLDMAVAVASVLGCLIVPYRLIGSALGHASVGRESLDPPPSP